MAAEALINIGTSPNDGTGDTLRVAFSKINGASSQRVFSTSGAGAVDDADVSLGSATFGTDNYAVLQALLDEAQNGPIYILWDGQYSISETLLIYSNTHILGMPGCGVIMRNDVAGSPTVFDNANLALPNSSPSYGSNIVDENISIVNLIMNGNNLDQTNRSAAVRMRGVRNFVMRDCYIYAAELFGFFSTNTENIYLENTTVDPGASAPDANHDGIHIDGYALNTTINGATLINCDDDAIAIMANENSSAQGPITNVNISNIKLVNCSHGVRIWHGANNVTNVTVNGITGNVSTEFIFELNQFFSTGGSNKNISAVNISGQVTSGAGVKLAGGTHVDVTITNINVEVTASGGMGLYASGSGTFQNVQINRLNVQSTLASSYAALLAAGSYERISINGIKFRTTATATVSPVSLTGGTYSVLRLIDADFSSLNAAASVPSINFNGATSGYLELENILTFNFQSVYKTTTGTNNRFTARSIKAISETQVFDIALTHTFVDLQNILPVTSGLVFNNSGAGSLGTWNGLWANTVSPSQITGDQNNYAPTGGKFASVLRLSTDASRTLTGLSLSQAGQRYLEIWNIGSQDIVLAAENASSTAANRFATGVTIAGGEIQKLVYDDTSDRWRLLK